MTVEGRLARGKENLLKKRFLLNSETMAVQVEVPKEKPIEKPVEKPVEKKIVKEKKDAK